MSGFLYGKNISYDEKTVNSFGEWFDVYHSNLSVLNEINHDAEVLIKLKRCHEADCSRMIESAENELYQSVDDVNIQGFTPGHQVLYSYAVRGAMDAIDM